MAFVNVFAQGPYSTKEKNTRQQFPWTTPPKPLLLVYPTEPGNYPLLIFFHGTMLSNADYKEGLFKHIASHGYIIVAPQMYIIPTFDAYKELENARKLTEWMPTGLSDYLPQNVCPDFQKMVVAGHSRGGKVAFGTALGVGQGSSSVKYSAIIGVDPVDGLPTGYQIPPPILSFKAHSFAQGVPALVIGSGTPNQQMSPDGLNHKNFFEECSAPAYHFVVKTCRHLDFLDDNFNSAVECVANAMGETCQEGGARENIRSFTAGIMVAFLNGCAKNDYSDLKAVLADPSVAPTEIEPPQVYVVEEKEKGGILSRL